MPHLKKASLKTILGGAGHPVGRVELVLSDGRLISMSAPIKSELYQPSEQLTWLEGLELEEDLPWRMDELVAEHWPQAPEGFTVILGLTLARALAVLNKQPLFKLISDWRGVQPSLPEPIVTIFNGGRFGDTDLDFDEFLYLPDAGNKKSRSEKLFDLSRMRYAVGELLLKADLDTDLGLLGGFAPDIFSSVEAMELMVAAGKNLGFNMESDYRLGVNIGAWHLFDPESGGYLFNLDKHSLQAMDLLAVYENWLKRFKVAYLEDATADNDETGRAALGHELRGKILVAGNSRFDDREDRLRAELKDRQLNAVVINPLRHKSLKRLAEYVRLAANSHLATILACQSEETEDDWLTDLACGLNIDYLKAGSLSRGEFVAKYNRLIMTEDYLADAV